MKKQTLKKCLFLFLIIIVISISITYILKYDVEGEKELPFYLEKILVISTVDGENVKKENVLWNINVKQNNDIFIYIGRREDSKEKLKNVTLENFKFQYPEMGEVNVYQPTGNLKDLYKNSKTNMQKDKIVYSGAKIDNIEKLEVCNQGGLVGFRVSLEDLGIYSNNTDKEIKYDGNLLKKIKVTDEKIEFSMKFDIVLEFQSGLKYRGVKVIDMPSKNLFTDGKGNMEIDNFEDLIFKREL